MRLILANKTALCLMCFIVAITIMREIKRIHSKTYSLPLGRYKEKKPDHKYILLWTDPQNVPFNYMGEGKRVFVSRKCPHTNCVVTANEKLLGDYRLFDVIAFRASDIIYKGNDNLPQSRLPYQKYVYASIESSHYYQLCSNRFDGYFNWTWTYRLDSDIRWGYIVIRDSKGNIIGPKKDMHWLDWKSMDAVSDKIKDKLKNKIKAAAWFVSNCKTKSERELFVHNLQEYLVQYDLQIDIFGKCGDLDCPNGRAEECNEMIGKSYYFYLSFENAFSEDYVTEKLLIPLQNNAIPIVYGGANYTRFLPNGSYLNARELGVHALGDMMIQLIDNMDFYAEYFRWKNHYTYHKTSESVETDEYCQMCALLNSEKIKMQSVYTSLREWWDPPNVAC